MNYKKYFSDELTSLKSQGLYRKFREINRDQKHFPKATERFEGSERPVEVWCSNDYLNLSQHPEVIKKFNPQMRYAAFKQKNFNYKLNLLSSKNPDWIGTRICLNKYLHSPQWLRELKFKKRPFWRIDKWRLNTIIENGGWHFCYLKGPEELLYKYQNLCETDDPINFKEKIDKKYLNLSEINSRIKKGLDIIGRDDFFTRVEVDETYPKYLLNNINNYFKWIDS